MSTSNFRVDVTKFLIQPFEARMQFQGLSHIAELCDRHDDMCAFMTEVVKATVDGPDLSFDERNLLSVAYKNAVGIRRSSWRSLAVETSQNDALSDIYSHLRMRIENELETYCNEIIYLLETYLINHPQTKEYSKVFYMKMAGDYFRYLAEFITTDKLNSYRENSANYYKKAMDTAEKSMDPTDPVRLGLALNYSVCLYEIIKDRQRACELAQYAFDQAILRRERSEENTSKDSELILQLLKDNLSLWTSNGNFINEEY
uniref:14-3-3 protein beta/alpha n=1 Tax=Lygus hesperus TaxID=30085 RepID=A0A146M871_LYGHE